jgi:imidazoleglycerol-phosphate dehydratase
MNRTAKLTRNTTETKINLDLDLNGTGEYEINTGIGFFDHMLELFTRHGSFNLNINADGDLEVDEHHTVEDVGIVLGQAFQEAIGDKKGINRYGFFVLPMDEVMTTAAFDFAGRSSYTQSIEFNRERVGGMSTELVFDFWDAFTQNAKASLIIKSEFGRNDHHKIEGIFKAVARAIRMAVEFDERNKNKLPSTKSLL